MGSSRPRLSTLALSRTALKLAEDRDDRFHGRGDPDQRTEAEKDRDRILYSTALRRLSGITQVVGAAEGHVFHNRLTHTLEVAQLSRRLAQQLRRDQPEIVEAVGGVDPEVAEAAALAHDLGHPPFGHIAEEELDELIVRSGQGIDEGFEGNAQSFRVVTCLTVRSTDYPGQNLTAATLNAILKYPWFRQEKSQDDYRHRKFGAYLLQGDDFYFARSLQLGEEATRPPAGAKKAAEAEIMDWADDIAYAVHDMEDFYRAGLVPLDQLMQPGGTEAQTFLEGTFRRWKLEGIRPVREDVTDEELAEAFQLLLAGISESHRMTRPYEGTLENRATLRSLSSELISRYVLGVASESVPPFRLREPDATDRRTVSIVRQAELEIAMLKQLTWFYVIQRPSLAGQQKGQRRVITDLFEIFCTATVEVKTRDMLPPSARELMEKSLADPGDKPSLEISLRTAADLVCMLSEQQAIALHRRYTGVEVGSFLEGISP
jgi:dGTPase